MLEIYDALKKAIDKLGWKTVGYDEEGRLIQYNDKTDKFRTLEEWTEIHKINEED